MKAALDFIANNDILGFGMEEWHKRFIEMKNLEMQGLSASKKKPRVEQ